MKNEDDAQLDRIEMVYINRDKLYKLPGNPRRVDGSGKVERLKAQILAHGFQVPLQVYQEGSGYTVLCGNHRLEAGGSIGMKEFPCIVYSGTKQDALARAISDNKTNEWTEWDIPNLGDMMTGLDDGSFDMFKTGFSQQELAALFGGPSEDPFAGGGQSKEGEVKFSEVLGEANNYVVLLFRNEVDWLAARTHFRIDRAAGYRANGEQWSIGVGRVLDGAQYLKEQNSELDGHHTERAVPDPFRESGDQE